MNFKEYITEYLPIKCGVHQANGKTAWLVFTEEQKGNSAYANHKFQTTRERAAMGMPYNPVNKDEYEKGLDVLEIAILIHRQHKHMENNQPEIKELQEKRSYDEVEQEIIASAMDIWNG